MMGEPEREQLWAEELERMHTRLREYWHDAIPVSSSDPGSPYDAQQQDRHLFPLVPEKPSGISRPLKLAINLKPGRRHETSRRTPDTPKTRPAVVSAEVDPVLERAFGRHGPREYVSLATELDRHLSLLDVYLECPNPVDDVRSHLKAASELLAATLPYYQAIAHAGIEATGDARRALLRHCAKHLGKQSGFQRLTARAAEVSNAPAGLFFTGEYER